MRDICEKPASSRSSLVEGGEVSEPERSNSLCLDLICIVTHTQAVRPGILGAPASIAPGMVARAWLVVCVLLSQGAALRIAPPLTCVPGRLLHNRQQCLGALPGAAGAKKGGVDNLKQQLSAAGRGGLIAYGVLNWLYYITVTTVAWNYSSVGKASAVAASSSLNQRVGLSVLRLGKVMGIVWAGSQITKPTRIAGAILTAPLADRLLLRIKTTFQLPSVERAFALMVAMLLGSTALFYAITVFGSALFM